MAIEWPQFRILPDPDNAKLWAYELLEHASRNAVVGGFRTPQEARKAVDRARKVK